MPTDLDPADRRQLLAMIGIGVPAVDACHAVGLSPGRYRDWMDERNDNPEVVAFREQLLRADGQGVAQQVKILWDGADKTRCEQHRFLLSRRRPSAFAPERAAGSAPTGPHVTVSAPVEPDVADQIVATLLAAGVQLPPDVRATLGLS